MTYRERLTNVIKAQGSHLCVGLDPVPDRIPGDVGQFLQQVIEQTAEYAAAFKANTAYFEVMGSRGYSVLEQLRDWIPAEIPLIIDSKRSDVPHTQQMYADAFYKELRADAVTVNPLMGAETIAPFVADSRYGAYVLGLTSNAGAADFLAQPLARQPLWRQFAGLCERKDLGPGTLGLVMGLTQQANEAFEGVPDVPLLIPGLGAQGGTAKALRGLAERSAPWIVNVSRGILYADESAAAVAQRYRDEINAAVGVP